MNQPRNMLKQHPQGEPLLFKEKSKAQALVQQQWEATTPPSLLFSLNGLRSGRHLPLSYLSLSSSQPMLLFGRVVVGHLPFPIEWKVGWMADGHLPPNWCSIVSGQRGDHPHSTIHPKAEGGPSTIHSNKSEGWPSTIHSIKE